MTATKQISLPKNKKYYRYIVGIDTGVNTGYAVWSPASKKIIYLNTFKIHEAMDAIKSYCDLDNSDVFIRVEDARKRTWFGNTGRERLKGAGSVERDAKIWEDFLTDLEVDFEMVHPKNNKTKLNAEIFKKITGYTGKTSAHARDAAMLIYQYN